MHSTVQVAVTNAKVTCVTSVCVGMFIISATVCSLMLNVFFARRAVYSAWDQQKVIMICLKVMGYVIFHVC